MAPSGGPASATAAASATVADVAVATGSEDVPVATELDTVAVGAAEEVGSAEVATMTELLPPTHSNIGTAVHG